jgi:hypothetical protein
MAEADARRGGGQPGSDAWAHQFVTCDDGQTGQASGVRALIHISVSIWQRFSTADERRLTQMHRAVLAAWTNRAD